MKIAILAAGDNLKWNRESVTVNGETLLERIYRQLFDRGWGQFSIYVSRSSDKPLLLTVNGEKILATIIQNELQGNDLGCIVGISTYLPDLCLFGDVYYSDEAMDKILSGTTNFYGRSRPSAIKGYGEMFAIKMHKGLWGKLHIFWNAYKRSQVSRAWSWDFYSWMQGKDFYDVGNTGNFTEITDETDDFDSLDEYLKWSKTYQTQEHNVRNGTHTIK